MIDLSDKFIKDGWEIIQTGGGCMAFIYTLPSGVYFMATDESGCNLPDNEDHIELGTYNTDGKQLTDGTYKVTWFGLRATFKGHKEIQLKLTNKC